MKNKSFVSKNVQNKPVKKKKTLSYYLVILALVLTFIGSILGSVAFVRSYADTEHPIITNYVTEDFTNGVDLTNNYLYIPKYYDDVINEYHYYDYSFNLNDFFFQSTGSSLEINFDYLMVEFENIYQENNDYVILYFDLDFFNSLIDNFNSMESTDFEHVNTLIVSNLFDSQPTIYYKPYFVNGSGVLGGIVGILTGGIGSIGSAVGNGLSSLASNIFLDAQGGLSTFGLLIVVFSAIALAIGLSRLIARWLSSLGGSRV